MVSPPKTQVRLQQIGSSNEQSPEYNDDMTVCIAGKFNNGNSLVLVADKQATGVSHQTEDHDKIFKLTDNIWIMLAGDDQPGQELYSRVKDCQFSSIGEWTQGIKETIANMKFERITDAILRPQGLTPETYLEKQSLLHRETAQSILNLMLAYKFPNVGFSVTVAGIDSDGKAKIYLIWSDIPESGHSDLNPFVVTGSIAEASRMLRFKNYKLTMTYAEALLNAYEAKKFCEGMPGIGEKTDIVIIDNNGSRKLTTTKVNQLDAAYQSVQGVANTKRQTVIGTITA